MFEIRVFRANEAKRVRNNVSSFRKNVAKTLSQGHCLKEGALSPP